MGQQRRGNVDAKCRIMRYGRHALVVNDHAGERRNHHVGGEVTDVQSQPAGPRGNGKAMFAQDAKLYRAALRERELTGGRRADLTKHALLGPPNSDAPRLALDCLADLELDLSRGLLVSGLALKMGIYNPRECRRRD